MLEGSRQRCEEKGTTSFMYDVILKLVTFHANLKNDLKM